MSPDVPDMTPRALAALLAQGSGFVLLDVREPFERDLCAIPVHHAVVDLHVPLGRVPSQLGALASFCEGLPTVVYCHHGVRSRRAAEWLAGQGIPRLYNLAGGIDAWTADVDPLLPRY